MKYLKFLFLILPFLIFSQSKKPSLKLVVEKGTFLFDKESLKERNEKVRQYIADLKKQIL